MSESFDFEALIQGAGDAIVVAGPDGTILLWNRAAERIFGHTEQEALGHSLDLIIPERFRIRHWEGFRGVMQTGQTRYGADVLRVPALHKDGRSLSIAFSVALLYSPTQRGPGDRRDHSRRDGSLGARTRPASATRRVGGEESMKPKQIADRE